jgi:hypothetical protein
MEEILTYEGWRQEVLQSPSALEKYDMPIDAMEESLDNLLREEETRGILTG